MVEAARNVGGLVPSTARGRATRERIVDAAADLMFERGAAGTSLDDVGLAARVGKSQMYHYFEDKSSLVHAVIQRQSDRVVDMQESLLPGLETWQAWQEWRTAMVEHQNHNHCVGGCPIGSLSAELADTDETARKHVEVGFERWTAVFRRSLAAMRLNGLLRPDVDVDRLAVATLATTQGGLLLCQAYKQTRPLEIALDAAIDNLRAHAPQE
jgi:TetR/AcrR family transcriptional repressor of nem operon